MVICSIQFISLKSFVDTTLQCVGQPEKFKHQVKEKHFLVIQHFSISKYGKLTSENTVNLH